MENLPFYEYLPYMRYVLWVVAGVLTGAGLYVAGRNFLRRRRVDRATCVVCGSPDVVGVLEGGFRSPDVLDTGYECRACGFGEDEVDEDVQPYYEALSRLESERSNLVRARNTASVLSFWDMDSTEDEHLRAAARRLNDVRMALAEIRDDHPAIRDLTIPGHPADLGSYLNQRVQASEPTDVPSFSLTGYFGTTRQLSHEAEGLKEAVDTAREVLRERVREARG